MIKLWLLDALDEGDHAFLVVGNYHSDTKHVKKLFFEAKISPSKSCSFVIYYIYQKGIETKLFSVEWVIRQKKQSYQL